MIKPTLSLLLPAMLLACSLTACNRNSPDAGTASQTLPAANAAVPATVYSVAQAHNLADIRVDAGRQLRALYVVNNDPPATPVVFAEAKTNDDTSYDPMLCLQDHGVWKLLFLPEFHQRSWVYAAECPERQELWGVLEMMGEKRGWELVFLRSTDAGHTWAVVSGLKKPHVDAAFHSFRLDVAGRGEVALYQADDTEAAKQGYYHYTTPDAGKTWTGPKFQADELVKAEDADTEQPLGEFVKTLTSAATRPQ